MTETKFSVCYSTDQWDFQWAGTNAASVQCHKSICGSRWQQKARSHCSVSGALACGHSWVFTAQEEHWQRGTGQDVFGVRRERPAGVFFRVSAGSAEIFCSFFFHVNPIYWLAWRIHKYCTPTVTSHWLLVIFTVCYAAIKVMSVEFWQGWVWVLFENHSFWGQINRAIAIVRWRYYHWLTCLDPQRARDLFYALWVPDLFMQRVEADGTWSLMCPNECPGLQDCWGEKFNELYTKYEAQGKFRKQVRAQVLWFAILDSQIETGTPYMLYKDSCNRKSNQQVGWPHNVHTCKGDFPATCTLVSLAYSYIFWAQSSVNSRTCHESFYQAYPLGKWPLKDTWSLYVEGIIAVFS